MDSLQNAKSLKISRTLWSKDKDVLWIVNWSSRILEDNDFPRWIQHCLDPLANHPPKILDPPLTTLHFRIFPVCLAAVRLSKSRPIAGVEVSLLWRRTESVPEEEVLHLPDFSYKQEGTHRLRTHASCCHTITITLTWDLETPKSCNFYRISQGHSLYNRFEHFGIICLFVFELFIALGISLKNALSDHVTLTFDLSIPKPFVGYPILLLLLLLLKMKRLEWHYARTLQGHYYSQYQVWTLWKLRTFVFEILLRTNRQTDGLEHPTNQPML